jgi:gamma-glutamyl hercynylcysteine S-oxide synthase
MSTAPLPTLDLPWHAAEAARHAEPASLRALLRDSRVRTLALADAWAATLGPQMQVPQWPTLNPPLWELGHVNWFARWWIGRNPHLARGLGADPTIERSPAAPNAPAESDAWYDSSRVAHAGRWSLPLPSLHHTVEHLAHGEDETLGLLAELGREPWAGTEDLDRALYFFRLALAHEDMHAEATVYMAHSLGHTLPEEWAHPCSERAVARRRDESGVWTLQPKPGPTKRLRVDATDTHIGHAGLGLFFDNEAPIHTVAVQAYEIDAQPLSWGEVLPFVASGAYARPEHWSQVGRAWREAQGQPEHPAVLKREGRFWRVRDQGRWIGLDEYATALHLNAHEADAWCRWAGRRLPTETEWEHAARHVSGFVWGQAWEWTASTFEPYHGFVVHPYRDYSQPWFGSRRVLRGAGPATHARMRHPAYRNFFVADRNDVHAGFRTCTA